MSSRMCFASTLLDGSVSCCVGMSHASDLGVMRTDPKVNVQVSTTSNLITDGHLPRVSWAGLRNCETPYLVILVQVFEEAFFVSCGYFDDVGGCEGGEDEKPSEREQSAKHGGDEGGTPECGYPAVSGGPEGV